MAQPASARQAGQSTEPGLSVDELPSEAKANRAFAVRLYQQLAKKPGNVFISPVSIAAAFGPVAVGARADTYMAISRTLGFRPDPKLLATRVGGLLRELRSGKDDDGAKVSIANALWLTDRHPVKADFVSVARSNFDAAVETVDFVDTSAAAKRINGWIEGETEGKITELFKEDAFDDKTALVVTNAVHFLGDWTQPFNAAATHSAPFYLPGGEQRLVRMMAGAKGVKYFEDDTLQMIDLGYKGGEFGMVVILPKARDGLSALEAKLSDATLGALLGKLDASSPPDHVEGVFVELPKVQIDNDHNLVDPLKAMGMGIAFDRFRANFRGMSDERLFISDVLHKTFLRIDEKGTEAAAATAVVMSGESSGPEINFRADHPFLVMIRDRKTGAILFFGRIAEP
ncbi:MAG TPA: serpin family protein [Sphingomicrobium sp.]|nr:serpin family protein [Sphingomicrobium sp.]